MTGLNKVNIPISFAKGIDTKTDYKQVIPGRFLTLENAIFENVLDIRKRNGYTALPTTITTGGSISLGLGTASYQNELLEFDGKELYSFSQSFQQWVPKGPMTSLEISLASVIKNTYQQTAADAAQHSSGLQMFAYENTESGGANYTIIDSVTGQAIVQDQLISATAIKPKTMSLGAYLIVLYIETTTHHLRFIAVPVTAPLSPLAAADLATDVNTSTPNYDATTFNTRVYVAYNTSNGGSSIGLRTINSFLVVSAEVQVLGENASGCITIFADTPALNMYVAYYNGTAVKYFVISSTLSSTLILAPTVIETVANIVRIIGEAASGSGRVWYEQSAAASYNTLVRTNSITVSGTVGSPTVFMRSVGLAGKPFFYNGLYYFVVTFSSLEQPTYFIVTQNAIVVGKMVPDNGGGLLVRNIIPETVQISPGVILWAGLQKDLLTTIGGTVYTQTGVGAFTFDFTSTNTFYRAQMAMNLHMTGGILEMYDGVNVVEHGFSIYPENVTFVQAASGPLSPGQYQYSVTYEWTDNQGQIHRSNPSTPTTVTVTGGTDDSVTLTIPTLRVTQKTGVRIVVYRTEANGTIFYQDTSTTSPLLNNPSVDSVTFIDTVPDSTIIGNPILYTTGGVVPNIEVPAPMLVTQYQDRLLVVPSESPYSFWYSKLVSPGDPVEFSDIFIENVDQRGGPITAFEQMDTNLIIFKENTIFYLSGSGPDNTGANNTFSDSQLITVDCGCINARSVVIMPLGLMFQSEKGIYLLSRSLQTEYIGAPVEEFNSDTITSAQLIADHRRVRFTMSTGTALEYDYFTQQWSTFTNHNANDSTIWENQFTFVNNDGQVWQETPGLYTDNGSFIKLRAVTSWLSMAQLQGYQRCYRALFLGDYISPHQLLVQVAYDFNPTFVQQDYINAGSILSTDFYGEGSPYGSDSPYGGAFPSYQWRIDLERQKCQSVQFSLEDVQVTDFGEGLRLSALNLMVGTKRGSNKLTQPQIFS